MAGAPTTFTVAVRFITDRNFNVVVSSSDTVGALKQRIFEREGLPPQKQNLLLMGRLLQPDTRALSEYNLKAGDTVYVTPGVRSQPPQKAHGAAATGSSAVIAEQGFHLRKPVQGAYEKDKELTPSVLAKKFSNMKLNEKSASAPPAENALVVSKASSAGPSSAVVPTVGSGSGSGSGTNSGSSGGGGVPGTEVQKLRASCMQQFATVTTVLRPHADGSGNPVGPPAPGQSQWPRSSQAYCVYTRKTIFGEVTGVITFGLSNPYQNTFFYAIGVGVEILLEAPTGQSRLTGPNGAMTGASISDSWMFAIVHEIGHQCFALGLQIRQLLEKLHVLSVEIGGITLPEEYLDPETGRCCVLLGHLGDPDVPRGFNVTVPHQHQWILQSVLFVPARLLTFEQCLSIRKDGTEARRKLAEGFVKTKHFHLCDVPPASWNKLTKAASPSTDPATAPAAASSSSSSSSAVSSAPAAASSSSGPIKTVVKK